jgi:hypothetical protein
LLRNLKNIINRMQFAQDFARGAETGDKGKGDFLFAKQTQEMRGMVLKKANTPFPRILAFLSPCLDGAVLPNKLSLYFRI